MRKDSVFNIDFKMLNKAPEGNLPLRSRLPMPIPSQKQGSFGNYSINGPAAQTVNQPTNIFMKCFDDVINKRITVMNSNAFRVMGNQDSQSFV